MALLSEQAGARNSKAKDGNGQKVGPMLSAAAIQAAGKTASSLFDTQLIGHSVNANGNANGHDLGTDIGARGKGKAIGHSGNGGPTAPAPKTMTVGYYDNINLETGHTLNDGDNPITRLINDQTGADVYMAFAEYSTGETNALVFQTSQVGSTTTQLAFLQGKSLSTITPDVLSNVTWNPSFENTPLNEGDTMLVKTQEGNIFVLGNFRQTANASEVTWGSTVAFDYIQLATATGSASTPTTTASSATAAISDASSTSTAPVATAA
jgi:hypothetical protein